MLDIASFKAIKTTTVIRSNNHCLYTQIDRNVNQ